jgi:hypothetical protein
MLTVVSPNRGLSDWMEPLGLASCTYRIHASYSPCNVGLPVIRHQGGYSHDFHVGRHLVSITSLPCDFMHYDPDVESFSQVTSGSGKSLMCIGNSL